MGGMKDLLGDQLYESQFPTPSPTQAFDGATYSPGRDYERLCEQGKTVFNLMRDGTARTLEQIETATGYPPASISARLRDLRKDKYGGHTVERKHIANGLYSYQLTVRR